MGHPTIITVVNTEEICAPEYRLLAVVVLPEGYEEEHRDSVLESIDGQYRGADVYVEEWNDPNNWGDMTRVQPIGLPHVECTGCGQEIDPPDSVLRCGLCDNPYCSGCGPIALDDYQQCCTEEDT